MWQLRNEFDEVLDAVIQEHRDLASGKRPGGKPNDFVSVLLDLPGENGASQLEDETMKAIILVSWLCHMYLNHMTMMKTGRIFHIRIPYTQLISSSVIMNWVLESIQALRGVAETASNLIAELETKNILERSSIIVKTEHTQREYVRK